jgi:rhamnogalacturonyl hydrolase YesR
MLRRTLIQAFFAPRRRTPRALAEQLAVPYGHSLEEAVYIPAVALMGRLRLGALDDVRRIAEPWVDGTKDSLAKATGSHLAGHLMFADLYERTRDARYLARVRAAADLGFNADGSPQPAMPLHNEMSDAVFMACPLLAKAGQLTGEQRYFDLLLRHFQFMEKLCLRPDGLYRHSPLCEAAWGRGNAFPALGLAWALAATPTTQPGHAVLRAAFLNLSKALARHQDSSGLWRQVVDHPTAYLEYSATAMIGTAWQLGAQHGWLPARKYRPLIAKAWEAIEGRTSATGELVDVCESTGKQPTLDDYLRRRAIRGIDPRGGAMGLLFATTLMGS